jgi:hypothetical protein
MFGEPGIARVLQRGNSCHPAPYPPRSLAGHSPEPPRSTSVSLTEVLRGGSGECPAKLRRCLRAAGDAPCPFHRTAKSPVLIHKLLWSVDIRLK